MPKLPDYSTVSTKRGSWLNRRTFLVGAASAAGAVGFPGSALPATAWKPSKPVHVLIGYPAGGAVDTVVRLVGEGVRRTTGAVVIGEVRSGAYGVIAAQAAAIAAPDGCTLASAIMG